jgi:hypothetical protein
MNGETVEALKDLALDNYRIAITQYRNASAALVDAAGSVNLALADLASVGIFLPSAAPVVSLVNPDWEALKPKRAAQLRLILSVWPDGKPEHLLVREWIEDIHTKLVCHGYKISKRSIQRLLSDAKMPR